MVAVNYTTMRNNFKDYCDRATDENEVVVITRKQERNVVVISLDNYNNLVKSCRNAAYLDMVQSGLEQMRAGTGKQHELVKD